MDNVKIKISKEKIYIKKGFLKKRYLIIYYFFVVSLIIFLAFGELTHIYFFNKCLEFINQFPFIIFLIKLNYIVLFITFFLHGISFGLAMYLETIICDKKIRLFTPNYKIDLNYRLLKKINVSPFYKYTSLRYKGGTFRGHFKDRSAITFITKDNEEYEWGYSLSYQKGMEIKKIIENKIRLELNDK